MSIFRQNKYSQRNCFLQPLCPCTCHRSAFSHLGKTTCLEISYSCTYIFPSEQLFFSQMLQKCGLFIKLLPHPTFTKHSTLLRNVNHFASWSLRNIGQHKKWKNDPSFSQPPRGPGVSNLHPHKQEALSGKLVQAVLKWMHFIYTQHEHALHQPVRATRLSETNDRQCSTFEKIDFLLLEALFTPLFCIPRCCICKGLAFWTFLWEAAAWNERTQGFSWSVIRRFYQKF